MIRPLPSRPTDCRSFEQALARCRSLEDVHAHFERVITDYERLNAAFRFSESFDQDFVFRQIDQRPELRSRELFGIPVGIKDIFNTKVLPTTMGSKIWEGFKAGHNARVVDEISDRGGVIFSKTTTAEFAVHFIQHGKTLNPHDPSRITGTSSSGSAVAVACGALPIALGTQTGGSITRPASFCGVFGFKPSFGAIDRTGCLKTADTLDTVGFLSADVYGLMRVLLATLQRDRDYPYAQRYFDDIFPPGRSARIGVLDSQFGGFADYDGDVTADFEAAVVGLEEMGHRVSRVTDADFINEIPPLHETIYCKSLSYYFQDELRQGTDMSAIMLEMIELGEQVPVSNYVDALQQQPGYRTRCEELFSDLDFIVTPSTASVAPPVGAGEKPDTSLIWSFLGTPTVSLPLFRSDRIDLPHGLQIVAPRFGDIGLLNFSDDVFQYFLDRG